LSFRTRRKGGNIKRTAVYKTAIEQRCGREAKVRWCQCFAEPRKKKGKSKKKYTWAGEWGGGGEERKPATVRWSGKCDWGPGETRVGGCEKERDSTNQPLRGGRRKRREKKQKNTVWPPGQRFPGSNRTRSGTTPHITNAWDGEGQVSDTSKKKKVQKKREKKKRKKCSMQGVKQGGKEAAKIKKEK